MNAIMVAGEDDVLHSSERPHPGDVNDYCRLCANLGENMVPIYADEGADHGLEIKIKTHLPFLNVHIDDILPKRICYHCASAVLVWDELFEFSTVADSKLRDWFEGSSYDQRECKTVPYDVMGELNADSVEFEDISDVNIFGRNEKSVKTFNDLGKISNSSKSVNMLNHELKSAVIQKEEKFNSDLKSDMSDLFDGVMHCRDDDDDDDDDDNEPMMDEHGMYVDDEDDMKRLMDCHQLDMSVSSQECVGVVLKREYEDDDENDLASARNSDGEEDDGGCGNDPDDDLVGCAFKTMSVNLKTDDDDDDGGGEVADEDEDEDDDDDDDEDDEGQPVDTDGLHEAFANGDDNETLRETMCEICATVFKTRYNLLRHFQKRHPEYKMFECDLCRISYPSIDEFKDHLEQRHSRMHTTQSLDSKQVRFACDVCGNMYKNKASAMNHLLTHTAKKTVHCTQCDFSCYTKQQLGVHQTKHDKRFVCDICHKRFAQKSQLDVHVNAVHYNHRPYSCVLCSKTFKTKGSHDAHMIVHTDTRNYQCPHCDKKCRKRYDLTLHIRTHTGEKPFKCSVCGRGFVQMCDTRKHEMLHFRRGGKRKTAPYCGNDVTAELLE